MKLPSAVLFDLDGTLLDTAPDLARALNAVRADDGLGPLPYADIRAQVSNGSYALTRLGFDYDDSSAEFEARRQALLHAYHEHIALESRLFDGMQAVLEALERKCLPWGIVTNKPAWLTTPLVAATELDRRAQCVISGDTTTHAKPHPAPLLAAADALALPPGDCLYVGDAARDIAAARAADMPVLVALYGYIPTAEDPHDWGGDGFIAEPRDLLRWL